MEASDDTALDLRKTKLTTDQALAHSSLSSLSLDFSPSRQTESQGHSFDFPALFMAQGVLTAAFNRAGKPTRPFKAYPKNPLSLTVKTAATETLDRSSKQAYLEFRQRMLIQMVPSSKRPLSPCHVTSAPVPGGEQDESRDNRYWQRRRKNNEAAKRSRDTRRAKEDEIAIRAAFLEQENLKLKCKVVTLTNELTRLRYLLYNT